MSDEDINFYFYIKKMVYINNNLESEKMNSK